MATVVTLLGRPAVEVGNDRHEPPFGKASALLFYLAFRASWVSRDELLALLWPDSDEVRARSNLRKLLSRDLKRFAFLDDLEVEPDRLRWAVDSDLAAFREAIVNRRWDDAAERYRGSLLHGVRPNGLPAFEDWLDLERQTLHDSWRSAALQSADDRGRAGDAAGALALLDRLHAADRSDEDVLRRLLRALAQAGRSSEVATTLAAFARHLDDEFGGEPEPETLALAEDLRHAAPAPPVAVPTRRAAAPPPHSNLPTPATPFVGRSDDLALIDERLGADDCRLLTLVGPGGMGKTRLAIEAAAAASESFANGVRFVPLAAVSDAERTLYALAQALDIGLIGREPPLTQLIEALRERELLLLLDNLEQLLDGIGFLGELLTAAPGIKVLATSRQRLRLRGEWVIDLGGLDFPSPGEAEPERFEAVQLFAQSARRAAPDFRLDSATLPAVARIAALVAGMALALELAASWLRLLAIDEVAEELEQGIDLLEGETRDAPERHRSIRAVFDASWRLLTPVEQRALRRLAAFRGGFDRRAAAEVAGVRLPQLAALVEKSFLYVGEGGRYQRHPLIYQVTRERLDADPEERREAEAAHAAYFLEQLRGWRDELEGGDQAQVLRDIAADLANLRLAWDWAIAEREIDALVAACEPLEVFHSQRNRFPEGIDLFERPAARLDPSDDREAQAVGRALASASWLYHRLGAYAEAGASAQRAADLLQRVGDARGEMKALNTLGNVANRGGDGDAARRHLQRALTLAEEHDYPRLVASYHNNLAQIDRREGKAPA
jgi:predicted ATPase/DNA-binding SARP family transcriptional activator